MKQKDQIDGTSQGAQTIADNDCKIYYAVTLEIIHHDEKGEISEVAFEEKEFRSAIALEARRSAFAYAEKLSKDADIDGKLCAYHIDSHRESELKCNKNSTFLFIKVYCVNEEEDGYDMLVSAGDWDDPSDDVLKGQVKEYDLYCQLNYDTEGSPTQIQSEGGEIFKVINFAACEQTNCLYYVTAINDPVGNPEKVIYSDRDGYIHLLTRQDISDNVASEQLGISDHYVLIKVSSKGIKSPIEPDPTDNPTSPYQRKVYQPFIGIEHHLKREFRDASKAKHRITYYYS